MRYPVYIPTTFTPLSSLIVSFHPHPIITTAIAGGEQRDSRSGYHLPRVRLLSSTVITITITAVEQSKYKDSQLTLISHYPYINTYKMPAAKQQDNEFLGKEMKYFSQAGFDLDRIHIKVSLLPRRWIALIISGMPLSPLYMKMLSSMKEPSFLPVVL